MTDEVNPIDPAVPFMEPLVIKDIPEEIKDGSIEIEPGLTAKEAEKIIESSSVSEVMKGAVTCGRCHKPKGETDECCNCGRPLKTLKELEVGWNEFFKKERNKLLSQRGLEKSGLAEENITWDQIVQEEYAEGASDIEIRVMLGISNDLWGRLMEEEQKFSETIEKGRAMAEAWWVRTGRTELKNKDFSYQGFRINMANRFNWREKIDSDLTSKGDKIEGLAVSFVKPKE